MWVQGQLEKTELMPNIKSGLCRRSDHGRVEWVDEGDLEVVAKKREERRKLTIGILESGLTASGSRALRPGDL